MHTDTQTETEDDEKQKIAELEKMKQNLEQQLQEMTRTIERQREMIAMAKRDPLTGLRNRQGIPELVNASLCAHCEGIFFIMDLDNFKNVNDTYGHMEGDRVLIKFAKAIKAVAEPKDLLARLGGDEFVVFSLGHYDKYEVKAKAQRFIRQIKRSLIALGKPLQVTVSVGIASAPLDGVTYEELYENADKALYSVKKEGKNGYYFFSDLEQKQQFNDAVCGKPRNSIEEITKKLKEHKIEGSFEVTYNHFEKIYRFMERNLIRDYREVQCVLFTLENYTEAEEIVIQQQMEHLQHAVVSSLRKGDVSIRYSMTQVLALMMDVNTENAGRVAERVLGNYRRIAGRTTLGTLYDIRQLTAGGDEAACSPQESH